MRRNLPALTPKHALPKAWAQASKGPADLRYLE